MPYLFAGTKPSSFTNAGAGVASSTVAGTFDSAYVDNSIQLSAGAVIGAPFAVTGTTVCLNADYRASSSTGFNYTYGGDTMRILNSAGTAVFRVGSSNLTPEAIRIYQWNGSSYDTLWTDNVSQLTTSIRKRFGLILNCGVGGSWKFFINGALYAGGAITSAAVNNAASFTLGSGVGTGSTTTVNWAEVLAADFDITNIRAKTNTLSALSAANIDGTGAVADLTDNSALTGFNLPAVGNKRGVTHAAVAIGAGLQISAVAINAMGAYASPAAGGRVGTRTGSTNTAGPNLNLGTGGGPRCAFLPVNPATGAPWTEADYNATELYFEAT